MRENQGAWVCISQADECSVNPELLAWDKTKKQNKQKQIKTLEMGVDGGNVSLWVERRLSVFDGLDGVRLNI